MTASIAGYSSFVASGQTGFPPGQALSRVMPAFGPAVALGDAILIWATTSNGGAAGSAIALTDNVNAGSYTKLLQVDDVGSGQASWYLYAMFNSGAAVPGTLVISATFAVLIWQGLFAFDVTGVTPSPLITAAVGNVQAGVGTGSNAITTGNIAAGASPAIVLAGVMNTTAQGVTNSGPPSAGTSPAYTQYIQDLNWNTSGGGTVGPEGTPNLPTATFEYLVSSNPGTHPATFTAFTGDTSDNYASIVVALQASGGSAAPTYNLESSEYY